MNKAHSVSSPADSRPDPDPAEAERAGRMLDRLAEMGMERAEAMHQAALAAIKSGDTPAVKDLELSLDRAARGVRRTLALKLHFAQKRQELADKAAAETTARVEEKDRRRRQVARIVTSSITTDPDFENDERLGATTGMWRQLLEDDDIDAALALADHPIEEIVLRLCQDMDVQPEFLLLADPGATAQAPAKDLSATDAEGLVHWPRTGPDQGRWQRRKSVVDGRTFWFDVDTCRRSDTPPWLLKPDGS